MSDAPDISKPSTAGPDSPAADKGAAPDPRDQPVMKGRRKVAAPAGSAGSGSVVAPAAAAGSGPVAAPAAAPAAAPNRPTRPTEPTLARPGGGAGSVAARDDSEFLPAALEILVTPPSPIAMWMMAVLSSAILVGLAWSYFGWLDIHAVASGKLQPSGRTKIVQPLEPGRVSAIHVENGTRVEAGQVLLELDPTETTADRAAILADLESARAEAVRRRAAVKAVLDGTFKPVTVFDAAISANLADREKLVLLAEIAQLRSQLASQRALLNEKVAMKNRLQSSIDSRENLIKLAQERVGMRKEIETKGAGSRAQVIESLQQLEQYITLQATERGQLIETDAAAASIERKMEEMAAQFVTDQTQKQTEIERKADRLEQELVKARSKRDRTELRSPLAGTVQQLAVNGLGQVVTTGQSVLTIVPVDGTIEVEAMIANKDIGFVKVGQEAVVKIEAFPFTRYGIISAKVIKISRDAVDDRDGSSLSDPATAARQQANSGQSTARTQNLVFPATLRLERRTIKVDGEEIALSPGMAVTVEIKTGRRRAIDYVLSPLREILSDSAHER